jgi:hypothetical protein
LKLSQDRTCGRDQRASEPAIGGSLAHHVLALLRFHPSVGEAEKVERRLLAVRMRATLALRAEVDEARLGRWLISGLTPAASVPAVLRFVFCVAAHTQGSLPAGRLGLCREGVEPSGPLREVSARVDDHPPLLLS